MVDQVNLLNRRYTYEFVEYMNLLKPTDKRDPLYEKKYKAWQKSFAFTKELQDKVNDLNNRIVLKGKPNTS